MSSRRRNFAPEGKISTGSHGQGDAFVFKILARKDETIMKRLSVLFMTCIFLLPIAGSLAAMDQPGGTAIERLKSPDVNIRAKAARELGKIGDGPSITALKGALIDPEFKVRREVVLALAAIHQPATLEPLAGASRDADAGIRSLAIQSMVGYYTGQIPGAGFTGFMKKNMQRAKSLFVDDETEIDPGVTVDPVVLAALQNDLSDTRSVQVQRDAARGLGELMARQAVPDLVKAAHSSDDDLARQSINSLTKIKDTSAGPQLIDLLDSRSKDVKRDAAVAVGILQARDATAKLQLIFENNPDKSTKEKALEGLAYLGNPISVPLFNKELWSPNKAFRVSAAEGLGRAGDPQNIPELQKAAIAEKDGDARLAMQFGLTDLGKDDYLNTLIQQLNTKLRGDAAQAYLTELSRNPEFLPKLYPYLNSNDATVRRRLAAVLVFTGDRTSIAPLEKLTHDSNSDVASAALRALRAIRARTAEKH